MFKVNRVVYISKKEIAVLQQLSLTKLNQVRTIQLNSQIKYNKEKKTESRLYLPSPPVIKTVIKVVIDAKDMLVNVIKHSQIKEDGYRHRKY